MSETLEDCILCKCTGCVERIPSFLLGSINKEDIKRTGDVVEDHIKKAKQELKQEKKDLRNREL